MRCTGRGGGAWRLFLVVWHFGFGGGGGGEVVMVRGESGHVLEDD